MTTRIKNEDMVHLLTGRTPVSVNRLISYYLKLKEVTLTKEQWSIIAVLWKEDGRTQQELADATYRDRPSTTRLLDNLQKDGFIERRPHPTDRRTNVIYLTSKGKKIENKVVGALNEAMEVATKGLKNEQLSLIRDTFNQINQNIQALGLNL